LKPQGKNNLSRVSVLNGGVRIIGIDPGSISCGYGVIEVAVSSQRLAVSKDELKSKSYSLNAIRYIASGKIVLSPNRPLPIRFKNLYNELIDIIKEYKPHEMVVEKIFFAKSAKAALNLGQARGIILLAAASEGLDIHEYSALEVKKAVTGYGRAEKRQVQEMVMRILNLKSQISNLSVDSADALALAICHLNTIKFKEIINKS